MPDFELFEGAAEEIRTSDSMLAELTRTAEAAEVVAIAAAPRLTGRYAAGFFVGAGVTTIPGIGKTAVARLGNRDYKAAWIEDGTVRQPPRRIIDKAIRAAGGGGVSTRDA